ncbi:MAG TPA: peroxiredoxin [Candidatus Lustribacter sp.]|jgi:peroxiredoxin|nr:peroxiredoxin [Candidatus Lustribacter sp.]
MKHALTALIAVLGIALAAPAAAELPLDARAPAFSAQVAQGGTVSTFSLAAALTHGPVVLYFFPKAFTSGCTAEAHDFADHIADFKALGATVVGVSGDSIETQEKFSTQECRSKFLVAADPGLKIASAYDSKVMGLFANRTSYVIAPDGKIVYAYTSLDPDKHVANTLAALRKLKQAPS